MANSNSGNGSRTVNVADFNGGDSKPALRLEHLNGARHAILNISEARAVKVPDGNGGTRNSLVVEFQEFPEHVFWCNKQDITALVERYGNDLDGWEGSPVPFTAIETTNPRNGDVGESLHVVRPLDWDAALSAGGVKGNRGAAAKRAAKKSPATKGTKRGKARGK